MWRDVASLPPDRHKLVPVVSDQDLSRHGAFHISEHMIPGPALAPELCVVVCMPTTTVDHPRPLLYWLHPGGMIVGNARTALDMMLDLAEPAGLAVISVEYRLAPENPHPAPVEDCYAGLLWAADQAEKLGVDRDRIIIGGGSAGGGLAAAVALMARDRGGPRPLAQMLMSPMLDDRNNTPSSFQMEGVDVWDHRMNAVGWSALLGQDAGSESVSAYASPARAKDFSNLPPCYIDVGGAETFRDEAVQYASRLWQAGCSTELHVWAGGFHGFERAVPDAALSQAAREAKSRWLDRTLRS
jgi:acetyl esterase/lipase